MFHKMHKMQLVHNLQGGILCPVQGIIEPDTTDLFLNHEYSKQQATLYLTMLPCYTLFIFHSILEEPSAVTSRDVI